MIWLLYQDTLLCVMRPKKTGRTQHRKYIDKKNKVVIFTHI